MTSAVVVGSGPNGLTAALRLARQGVAVTVLEAAEEIGGGTRSGELSVPGVIHDHCSAVHPMGAASPTLTSFDLERFGLRWRWPDIDCAHPFADGTAALLHRDVDKTADGLGVDGQRWARLIGAMGEQFPRIATDVLRPMVHVPRHPISLARFGLRAGLPATVLARAFRTDPAAALFSGVAAHAFTRLDRPGSAAAGMMLLAAGHRAGWPVAEGGSRAIADALAAALVEEGGRIETGVTVTSHAELSGYDLALLDVMPGAALRILGERLPRRTTRAYRRYRHGTAAYKVDYVIDGDVGWQAPGCAQAGTVHLGGTAEQVADAERHAAVGQMPAAPFTLVGQQWVADPTRSNGSLNPVWAYAHVPHSYTGDATEVITAHIESYAPGFRDRIIATHVRTPAQLQADNANYVGGDIGGGANDLAQLLARPRLSANPYATGIPGVYLCSSATPPGGGVHGMCGDNAATAALKYLADR